MKGKRGERQTEKDGQGGGSVGIDKKEERG